jgi:hypothetical protein
MSAITQTGRLPVSQPATFSGNLSARDTQAGQTLLVAICLQVALLLPSLIALSVDERTLNDISVWSKPIKFEASLILLMATLVWLLPLIKAEAVAGRVVRWTATAIALMATIEISYIVLQAARGRASHFNLDTPLEAYLYNVMGIGAVTIVVGCFIIGLMIWRQGEDDAPRGLRYGAAIGLMLGAVLTLITAGVLGSGQLAANSHWVGGVRSDAGGLFLVGWSRSGGDLRVPHFFATHIMQGLPILGLLLDRLAPRFVQVGLWIGAFAGVLLVAGTFVQAIKGIPFL